MPLLFHIPGALREFTAGHSTVKVEYAGDTVHHALTALCATYPGVRDRILTEQGQVRQHINIFIDTEDIRYTGGLATKVADGSEISVVPAVSGGKDSHTSPTESVEPSSANSAVKRHCRFKQPNTPTPSQFPR